MSSFILYTVIFLTQSKYYDIFTNERSEIMNVSQRITNILNYYKENPNCDPNMFEFAGLCYDMVQYLNKEAPTYGIHCTTGRTKEQAVELYPIPCAVYEKFQILSQQFSEKLLNNDLGITEEAPLYRLYRDLAIGVGTYSAYGDTPLRQKLAGVSLFIAQNKRDVARGLIPEFSYDNAYEIEEIQKLNQELHDPQAGGHYTGPAGETDINKMTYVKAEPSPRQLLLEEIMNEYEKGLKTR